MLRKKISEEFLLTQKNHRCFDVYEFGLTVND